MDWVVIIISWGDGENYAGKRWHSVRFYTKTAAEQLMKAAGDNSTNMLLIFDPVVVR